MRIHLATPSFSCTPADAILLCTSMPDFVIYKMGTLDDKSVLDNAPPVSEIYTKNRPNCLEPLQGCEQKKGQTE